VETWIKTLSSALAQKALSEAIFGSALGQRFMRDIGGYNLNAAADFLATIAKFQDENGND
jgi:hypothetical protein